MIFLDTGFVFALVYADDVHHARVREVLEKYRGRALADFVITTNHVVAETVTLLRMKAPRPAGQARTGGPDRPAVVGRGIRTGTSRDAGRGGGGPRLSRQTSRQVFFAEERMGLDARPFRMLKFRSIRVDAEASGPGRTTKTIRGGRVGTFIRKTSLDEFPQFINVLMGDMSVVGPAPSSQPTSSNSAAASPATWSATARRPASPAGRRSTACAATRRSPSAPNTTCGTSRTGRSGSIQDHAAHRPRCLRQVGVLSA